MTPRRHRSDAEARAISRVQGLRRSSAASPRDDRVSRTEARRRAVSEAKTAACVPAAVEPEPHAADATLTDTDRATLAAARRDAEARSARGEDTP